MSVALGCKEVRVVIRLYNTQTRQKEVFIPIEEGKVKMYCCGVTVYDYCHLGHARSYIVWDVLRRYLEFMSYQVTYVQNFTDIDDKILARANLEGTSMGEVSERFIQAYFDDIRQLGIKDADVYPRVTDYIPGIINLIQALEDKGIAYVLDGSVYYSVSQFSGYGALSNRSQGQMMIGGGGRVNKGVKRHPSDFVLWKRAKVGEPYWESPWGKGRPGWHIECSAMVKAVLGTTIDIHGGGSDLIFPHHENEVAQSEGVSNQPLSNYWLHNGMVTVKGDKMSKSEGNFTTIRDLLGSGIDPMAVRLFVLQAHYRKPIDFTQEGITSAQGGWSTLREGLMFGIEHKDLIDTSNSLTNQSLITRFKEVMGDDINTPEALAILFELAKELRGVSKGIKHGTNISTSTHDIQVAWSTLVELSSVLGLEVTQDSLVEKTLVVGESEINLLIAQRQVLKVLKDYQGADKVRNNLKDLGVILVDLPDGRTTWYRE